MPTAELEGFFIASFRKLGGGTGSRF